MTNLPKPIIIFSKDKVEMIDIPNEKLEIIKLVALVKSMKNYRIVCFVTVR